MKENPDGELNETQKLIIKAKEMPVAKQSPFYDEEFLSDHEDSDVQKNYIISNPDILKMHLDILYKTVDFLD